MRFYADNPVQCAHNSYNQASYLLNKEEIKDKMPKSHFQKHGNGFIRKDKRVIGIKSVETASE